MRKIFILTAVAAVAAFSFSGCHKLADHYFHHDTTVVSSCRIAKIIQAGDEIFNERTGTVYYNERNNPDSVIGNFEGSSSGPALFYFIYDDHHRLIEYREDYSREPGDYYFKHTYAYENGVAIRDTMRARQAGQWTEVGDIHYDANGRIIKVTRHIIELDYNPADQEDEPFEYSYDAFGNLYGDQMTYDDKISFLRTNKIWMFIKRNYSVNNRLGPSSYNESGLPLTFEMGHGPSFLIEALTSIEYECAEK